MRRFSLIILMTTLLLGLGSIAFAALTTYSTTIGGTQTIDIDTGTVSPPFRRGSLVGNIQYEPA